MLTRRNAILTSAALAAGATQSLSAANSTLTASESPALALSQQTHPSSDLVAHQCLLLSEIARKCTLLATENTDFQTTTFVQYCQDVRDICAVTATILSRKGPGAPAICQACADAAQRLAASCQDVEIDVALNCETLARRCATACRQFVARQSA